jgi:outer membrane protein
MKEAVRSNLDFLTAQQAVSVSKEGVRQALAAWRPQANMSLRHLQIDPHRQSPQRTSSVLLAVRQLLISVEAQAEVSIQKSLLLSQKFDRDTSRLDLLGQTAISYFNVLLSKNFLSVSLWNQEITAKELQAARQRSKLGLGPIRDITRWQSELTAAATQVLQARSGQRQSEIEFNQLLNRPLEERPELQEADVGRPFQLLFEDSRIEVLARSSENWRILQSFFLKEALFNSTELRSLSALIQAQRRQRRSIHKSFRVPEVSLQGELQEDVSLGGAFSQGPNVPNKTSYSVFVQGSIPLTQGGLRRSQARQNRVVIAQLETFRSSTELAVRRRARNSLLAVQASYPSLPLSQELSEQALSYYQQVSTAYAKGDANVVTLIEAKSNAVSAALTSRNAVYNLLSDLTQSQRAAASFPIALPPKERSAWSHRLEAHLTASKDL